MHGWSKLCHLCVISFSTTGEQWPGLGEKTVIFATRLGSVLPFPLAGAAGEPVDECWFAADLLNLEHHAADEGAEGSDGHGSMAGIIG